MKNKFEINTFLTSDCQKTHHSKLLRTVTIMEPQEEPLDLSPRGSRDRPSTSQAFRNVASGSRSSDVNPSNQQQTDCQKTHHSKLIRTVTIMEPQEEPLDLSPRGSRDRPSTSQAFQNVASGSRSSDVNPSNQQQTG
ncbi:hypothetical protein Bhyg_00465 [Pseudolycoriella hygida]|uniref:Uncharacterized protein n=1 Tax=Pseudolycoriella hygida TaxID=35572 RepID=A0A9Q0N8X9_9DIPT|nr:hypothetical protein Bhyg_00465 [Pseudolycoriella hygida]